MNEPVKIIAEAGLNHNGDIDKAKRLIDIASVAGCNYVKFQKRNPDLCVPEEQKNISKKVPWREEETTYLQYKKDIEFSIDEYQYLYNYALSRGMILFASIWDIESAEEMSKLTDIVKIPSALVTDLELLEFCSTKFDYKILSTGMSWESEIREAVKIFGPDVIMHTDSEYPSKVENLRLEYIKHLNKLYYSTEIGYSNHFYGLTPCFAAVALGATWIEVHICEDHRDWGTDQSSSVEPAGLIKLVRGIRDLELALKGDRFREPTEAELKKRKILKNNKKGVY
jgi:N-acetylneuraminate synthase